MIDDPVMRRITTYLKQALADLQLFERDHDAISQILAGGVLDLDDAAYAWGCSDETMRKECEKAAAKKKWIGVKFRKCWIIGRQRLLDWIELQDGLHARLVAEDRLKERGSRTQLQQVYRKHGATCSPPGTRGP
jgi:hypothetical protein